MLLPALLMGQGPPNGEATVVGGSGWSYLGKEVQPGKTLPSIAELTGSASSDLVLSCGSQWLAYSCKAVCKVPVCSTQAPGVVVRRVDPQGWAAPKTVGNLLASFLYHAPKSVQTLGVRAAGNLDDAVVRQSMDKVFFAPALARLLEGKYCFVLAPLPPSGGSSRSFWLEWNHEGEAGVDLPNLAPGLYTLERGSGPDNGTCHSDPDSSKAWVLVAGGSTFNRANEEWRSYAAGLEQLATDASPGVASTMSHALLAMVADSSAR